MCLLKKCFAESCLFTAEEDLPKISPNNRYKCVSCNLAIYIEISILIFDCRLSW